MGSRSARSSSRTRSRTAWTLIVCGLLYLVLYFALGWQSLGILPAFAAMAPAYVLVVTGAAILGAESRRRQDAELPRQRRLDGTYEDTDV